MVEMFLRFNKEANEIREEQAQVLQKIGVHNPAIAQVQKKLQEASARVAGIEATAKNIPKLL